MKCAFLSFQPFLDRFASGQASASAAMVDSVSALAELQLVYLTPSEDLVKVSHLLRERFPAVSAIKVVQYHPRISRRAAIRYGAKMLPTSLGALESERVRHVVAELHRDRSIDVVHYDLMTWLYVHPDSAVAAAPTVCSGTGLSSLSCREKAHFSDSPVVRARERVRALALERFERRYLSKADVVHLASAEHVAHLQSKGIGGVLRAVNVPLEDRWFQRRESAQSGSRRVLASGPHSYPGYRAGLLRFLSGVWPPQATRFPDVALTVQSTDPVHETEAATHAAPRTTLVGAVPDLGSLFSEHGIFVDPVLGGIAQRQRLAIALAQGACCLATDAAISGMGLTPREDYLPLADLSQLDAAQLGEVLEHGDLAASVGASGRRRMLSEFSTKAVGKRLMDLYREAIEIGRERRAQGA